MPFPPLARLAPLVALAVLLAGCTSREQGGVLGDRDADNVDDAVERAGWTITVQREDGNVTLNVTSDPARPDTDGDGLGDFVEHERRLNPREVDTDGDGLLDGKGLEYAADSSVGKAFAEWGILPDPATPGRWLGEADYCPETGGLSPESWDSDDPRPDGVGDAQEILGWDIRIDGRTVRVTSNPCRLDTDQDGLYDGDERRYLTDPNRVDSDRDEARDAFDGDPLRDVGLRVKVESVTLAGPVAAGDSVVVRVTVPGREEPFARPATNGTVAFGTEMLANVPDDSDVYGALATRVLLRVLLVSESGEARPLRIAAGAPDETLVDMTVDAVAGKWSYGDQTGRSGAFVATGSEGSVRASFVRADY